MKTRGKLALTSCFRPPTRLPCYQPLTKDQLGQNPHRSAFKVGNMTDMNENLIPKLPTTQP